VLHPLADASGQTIATLHLDFKPWRLTRDSNAEEMTLLVAISAMLMASVFIFLHFSILKPFEIVTQSLVSNNPDVLKPLINNPTEIGHIARLVRIHFAQLRTLNETMEDKAQLARDLHDGVIQSIYASGLGIATAQAHLRTDPAAADMHLQQIRNILNETIQETRSFITGLESKEEDTQPFSAAVETLIESMSWIRKVNAQVEIEKTAASELSPTVRGQTMQMIREAISNSLRHGQAHTLRVSLKRLNGKIDLLIADDGIGFDPAQRKESGGHGLNNLIERAHIFGAVVTIDSSPGKGTCVHVVFSPTTTPPV
jgi:signal transduction histidine kinase